MNGNFRNMQSWIWHEPLAQSAFCAVSTCDITPSDPIELARRFQQSTTLKVSDDPSKIIIGETSFISDNWIDAETSIIVKCVLNIVHRFDSVCVCLVFRRRFNFGLMNAID